MPSSKKPLFLHLFSREFFPAHDKASSMPEMASLIAITRNSFQALWRHRSLWWFAVPVGTLVGLSSFVMIIIQDRLPNTPDFSSLASLFSDYRLFGALGASFIIVLCQSAMRGSLIVFFVYQTNETGDATTNDRRVPWRDMSRACRISAIFETAYWFALFGIGTVLAIPSLLAQRFNPSIMPTVFELGFLLLITIGVYLYFTKELSCLYAILGKTGFRSAGDLGFRLFRRHAFNTVLFFFYAALLALFFSILIESFFRLVRVSTESHSLFQSLLMAIPFGFYYIFDQLLRVSFFRSIATSPKKPAAKGTVLETSQTPSGISPN